MVLRLIQELIGIVLGERDGGIADEEAGKKEEMREKAGRLLDRMPAGIMISPCLNFELTDETIEAAKKVSNDDPCPPHALLVLMSNS